MESAKIEIEIIRNGNGKLFIKFLSDGAICPVKDIPQNLGLFSALEVELEFELRKQKKL